MKTISFDFDVTLRFPTGEPNTTILKILKEKMNRNNIIILTTRKETKDNYNQITEFLKSENIDPVPIHFTNGDWKWKWIKSLKILEHWDDDTVELNAIKENVPCVKLQQVEFPINLVNKWFKELGII